MKTNASSCESAQLNQQNKTELIMDKLNAMKIAQQYAAQHFAKCNIVWYAGEKSGWHFVWIKNTAMPRYTGFGNAIKISPSGEIVKINSNTEIHQISKSAIKLHDGDDFL